MSNEQSEIQKRLTLNWLIQGAAQHAGMTFHHLVRDKLNALQPELLPLYDQYALINLLQYWHLEATMLLGSPARFWKQAGSKRSHPFFGHRLLAKYGGELAECGRQRAVKRSKEKGISTRYLAFSFQTVSVIQQLRKLETPHRPQLVQLAKTAASTVWGIPCKQLEGELSDRIVLQEDLLPTHSRAGDVFRACIVGYGGVVQRSEGLKVVGKGTNWQLLAKELVKGTAELICLHGLNQLDEDLYRRVIEKTDRLELEPWMLQSGGELWRRLLASLPDGPPVANVLMNLARLPPATLESTIAAVIEEQPGVPHLQSVDTPLPPIPL